MFHVYDWTFKKTKNDAYQGSTMTEFVDKCVGAFIDWNVQFDFLDVADEALLSNDLFPTSGPFSMGSISLSVVLNQVVVRNHNSTAMSPDALHPLIIPRRHAVVSNVTE